MYLSVYLWFANEVVQERVNLAITDFFCLTIALPWHIYVYSHQQININTTSFIGDETLMVLVVITGSNTILCITIDRFVAVVYPLRHPNIINTRVMTVLSWGTAVLVTLAIYLCVKFAQYKISNINERDFICYNILPHPKTR